MKSGCRGNDSIWLRGEPIMWFRGGDRPFARRLKAQSEAQFNSEIKRFPCALATEQMPHSSITILTMRSGWLPGILCVPVVSPRPRNCVSNYFRLKLHSHLLPLPPATPQACRHTISAPVPGCERKTDCLIKHLFSPLLPFIINYSPDFSGSN